MSKETKPLKVFATISLCVVAIFLVTTKVVVDRRMDDARTTNEKVAEAQKAITEIQYEMEKMLELSQSNDLWGYIQYPREQVSTGLFGEVEKLFKSLMLRMAELQKEYIQALENAGWFHVLDYDRLSRDSGLEESRSILRKAIEAVDIHELEVLLALEISAQSIDTLDLSDHAKRDLREGYEEGLELARENSKRNMYFERQIIQEMTRLIDFLFVSNSWIVEDSQIYFEKDEDVLRFNMHLQRIEEVVQQQNDHQSAVIIKSRSELEKLKASF